MDDYDFNPSDYADAFASGDILNLGGNYNFNPNDYADAFSSGSNLMGSGNYGSNLNTSQLEKGFNMDVAKAAELARAGEYDPTAALPSYGNQDAGITQAMIDEYTKNYNPEGGFGSQWQTVGTNKIMINDDGTGTVLDPTTNETAYLSKPQVQALIKNGTLNSKPSGYVKSSGGIKITPGGSKPAQTGNAGALMALMAAAGLMGSKGGSSEPTAQIPSMTAERSQTDYGATKPGSANVEYFTPTTYKAKAAGGGLMSLANGGMSDLSSYSDGGRLLRGPGDGVSDSIPATIGGKQPARLATGEFVVPARIVSELGNGSTEAGAKKLYAMMDRVQKARRRTKNVAADTKAHKYLPA
jgi:hypothetical protein